LATVWSVRASANLAAAIGEHATGAAGAAQVVEDPDLHAAGPAMAAVGAGLLVMSGLVAAVRATAWPGMGTRYDRVTTPRPHQAETPSDLWKSLDAGDDPTLPAPDGDGVSACTAGHAADIGDKTAPSAVQPTETKESPDDRRRTSRRSRKYRFRLVSHRLLYRGLGHLGRIRHPGRQLDPVGLDRTRCQYRLLRHRRRDEASGAGPQGAATGPAHARGVGSRA